MAVHEDTGLHEAIGACAEAPVGKTPIGMLGERRGGNHGREGEGGEEGTGGIHGANFAHVQQTRLKYPIGRQDFRNLRTRGYAYVDKTERICEVLDGGYYYFYARPRRFGKSLTISTMRELYSGDRDLFEGLWAYDHWDFEAMRRPVIHLVFADAPYQREGLEYGIGALLAAEAQRLGVELEPDLPVGQAFGRLIARAAASSPAGRVVVLVDEYDKPLIDYLAEADRPRLEENRRVLKSFYSVLKDAEAQVEVLFVTGVSAFSKVSLFSDLNNLYNITLGSANNALTGLTAEELERYFGPRLDALPYTREEIRHWYNGYSWDGHETVYNPWSILNLLQRGAIDNYWFTTGTPTFLTELLRDQRLVDVGGEARRSSGLLQFSTAPFDPVQLFFQTGYLTVKSVSGRIDPLYHLDYPNQEVRVSFQRVLLEALSRSPGGAASRADRLRGALEAGDLPAVIAALDAAFADLPYDIWRAQSEFLYHAIAHTLFGATGLAVRSELHTARGRADLVCETPERVYCFEFKLDAGAGDGDATGAEAALAQILTRGYLDAYADDARRRLAVGVDFSSERKAVDAYRARAV